MSRGTVKKAAAIVMLGMIVSRILGYVRYKAIFYFFGRGFETDAFFGAFAVPDLLYILASGGAMTAAFIPMYSELLEKNKREEAYHLVSGVINFTFVVVGLFVGLGIVFAPQLVRIIVPGFNADPKTFELCVVIVRIIFPMVMLTSMSAICNGVLQSHDHFLTPAVAWSLHNIGIITAAIVFHKLVGIKGLAYGVLAGAFSMVALQLPVMIKKGVRYLPKSGLSDPGVRKVLILFLPAMLGLSISQVNLFILPMMFGSFMGEGAVSALQGAVRLLLLPLGIFGNAISMAIFPTLSRQVGGGRMVEFRDTLARGINMTLVFSIPSMVIFLLLGVPLTRVLFGGGQFTLNDCSATAIALFYYAFGLPGHTAVQVVTRGYYSLKDTRTPFVVGLLSVIIITIPYCLGVSLPQLSEDTIEKLALLKAICAISPFYHLGRATDSIGYAGVALAVSMATIFNVVALVGMFRFKIPGMPVGQMGISLLKVSAASALMALACTGVLHFLAKADPALQLGAGLITSGIVFIVLGRMFKIDELQEIIDMFAGKFKRKKPAAQV